MPPTVASLFPVRASAGHPAANSKLTHQLPSGQWVTDAQWGLYQKNAAAIAARKQKVVEAKAVRAAVPVNKAIVNATVANITADSTSNSLDLSRQNNNVEAAQAAQAAQIQSKKALTGVGIIGGIATAILFFL